MNDNTYDNEFITAEAIKSLYGIGFNELMSAADRGLIRRRERVQPKDGRTTFTFRRGDVISMEAGDVE